MMRKPPFLAVATVMALTPVVAKAERIVDYAIDEAKARQEAEEQGVAFTPLPQHGSRHVAFKISPEVDHQVMRGGIFCSAWTVENPISHLLTRFLTAWDKDGKPGDSTEAPADLSIQIDHAATLSRCVSNGEMQSTCITRVTINGSSISRGAAPQPFHIEREMATKGLGVCAGLTRGIGAVSRQTAGDLIDRLGTVDGSG